MLKQPSRNIPLHRPCIGEAEIEAVVSALRQGSIVGNGSISRHVEQKLRERCQSEHAFLTPSCTAAMELAMLLFDVVPGDEVIMPSFGFASVANAVVSRGARPVFADILETTANLDPNDVEKRITAKTRAVIAVHYAGVACDMDRLMDLCESHQLLLIEDAAQAVGSSTHGHHLGTLGDVGCFSFHETKNLVAGEGGAMLVQNKALADRIEILREKGTNRVEFAKGNIKQYAWVDVGGSYLMSDLLASLLDAQLDRQFQIESSRREIHERYVAGLREFAQRGWIHLPVIPPDCRTNYHIFFFRTSNAKARDRVLDELQQRGVGATFHFVPLHSSPFALSHFGGRPDDLPVTVRVAETIVRLPIYPELTSDECQIVLEATSESLSSVFSNLTP